MFNRIKLAIWLIPILLGVSVSLASAEEKLSYTIGPRDTLEISVWQHIELNRTVTVRPDGKISFSLVGDVNAAGLTPAELDEVITRRLSKYLQTPEVTVIVTSFGSRRVFVLGEVARPGVYPIGITTTVLEVITDAGSYTESADLRNVTITRKSVAGTPREMTANLERVIKNGDASKDVTLEPDDIVNVPKRFSSKVGKFLDVFFARTLPPLTMIYMIDEMGED